MHEDSFEGLLSPETHAVGPGVAAGVVCHPRVVPEEYPDSCSWLGTLDGPRRSWVLGTVARGPVDKGFGTLDYPMHWRPGVTILFYVPVNKVLLPPCHTLCPGSGQLTPTYVLTFTVMYPFDSVRRSRHLLSPTPRLDPTFSLFYDVLVFPVVDTILFRPWI